MKRRDFLRTAGGSAASVAAASGLATGQEGTGTATGTPSGTATGTATTTATGTPAGGGGGPTKEVVVGPGGSLTFEPAKIEIKPGTTVKWVWDSDGHNVVPTSQPEGASWKGHQPLEDTGFEYEHTFTVKGTYDYVCEPHASAGMTGTIVVTDNPKPAGGKGGGGEQDLHDIGVAIQAHWVGAATILMILVSVVFTFYVLKYGESPNTGNTGGGE